MSDRKLLATFFKEWDEEQRKGTVKSAIQFVDKKFLAYQAMKDTIAILGNRRNFEQFVRSGHRGLYHWYYAKRQPATFGFVAGRYPHSSAAVEHDTQVEYEAALYLGHHVFVLAKWFKGADKVVKDITSLGYLENS